MFKYSQEKPRVNAQNTRKNEQILIKLWAQEAQQKRPRQRRGLLLAYLRKEIIFLQQRTVPKDLRLQLRFYHQR